MTVTVVLNVRKLASFMLSCFLFGNELTPMMVRGAGVVFVSGAVYGFGGARAKAMAKARARTEGEGKDPRPRTTDRAGTNKPFDSLAITKGYATPPVSPRQTWRDVRSTVQGIVGDEHTVAGMSELDGSPAVVHENGTMSPRMWRRRESDASARSWDSLSPGARDGVWASGARVNEDGTMVRR